MSKEPNEETGNSDVQERNRISLHFCNRIKGYTNCKNTMVFFYEYKMSR